MPIIQSKPLTTLVAGILAAVGTPQDIADVIAESLVDSSLKGVDSHGVLRVPQYLDQVKKGWIQPSAKPLVKKQTSNMSSVNGNHGFGIYSLSRAMDIAIQKAKANQFAVVGLTESTHTGRIGWFAERAASQEVITIIAGGGAHGKADHMSVAPYGGAARVMATNPITLGFPAADCAPVIVDMSTSATAEGKLRFYREIGEKLPPGWILDKSGQPSSKADDFYDDGMILPFAGHKGYGLGVAVEFLTGILLGDAHELNWLILALDIAMFREKDEYATDAAAFIKTLKETPAATGFVEVMAPGEPEARVSAQRESEGIPLPDTTWKTIKEIAHEVGLSGLNTFLDPTTEPNGEQ